jgi:hypothetical protein
MAEQQAHVRSVDAIEAFRSALIVFLTKAKPTLEEVVSEVTRTRQWVEHDQRVFWQKEMKVRHRELEQAQGELFSSRLSRIDTPSAAQQLAVQKATRAIRHAEEKLRILKKWDRELETRTEPSLKLVEQLHGFLTADMGKAVAYLTHIIQTLQAYSESGPAPVPIPSGAAAESTATESESAGDPRAEAQPILETGITTEGKAAPEALSSETE